MKSKLAESIAQAPSCNIVHGDKVYHFDKFDFGERGVYLTSSLIREIGLNLVNAINTNFDDFDSILSSEPGGHTWGLLCSYLLNKPLRIVRKYDSKLSSGETVFERKTAYANDLMYTCSFKAGERVLIIEDVVSTGGTCQSLIFEVRKADAVIVGIQCIYLKKSISGDFYIQGVPIRCLEKK